MKTKVYRSKIGAGLVIPLAVVLSAVSILMIQEQAWPVLPVLLLPIAFITHMLFTTSYTLGENGMLKITCGFLYKISIPISSITKIEENRTLVSSPAASFDRIEIFYNKFDSVLISPKDKVAFIEQLLSMNPGISTHLKLSGKAA